MLRNSHLQCFISCMCANKTVMTIQSHVALRERKRKRKREREVGDRFLKLSAHTHTHTQSKLDNIGKNLTKIITTQNYFQARESRHRHTQDSNHNRVMWWSLLECSVIITVGVIEVVLIRNLFRTTRKDNIRT